MKLKLIVLSTMLDFFVVFYLRLGICLAVSLIDAVREQNVHLAKVLAKETNVNELCAPTESPLVVAIGKRNLPLVKVLVEAGAFVNPVNDRGIASALAACLSDDVEIAKYLIENGADMDKIYHMDDLLFPPSYKINCSDDLFIFPSCYKINQYLMDEIWWDKERVGSKGIKPLKCACIAAPTVAKFLIVDKNANMHNIDSSGETPLFYAAADKTGELAELMMDRGADPAKKSYSGSTPLHAAASAGNLKMMTLLLDSGKVNVDAINNLGITPLRVACNAFHLSPQNLSSLAPIRMLLAAGANPYIENQQGLKFIDYTFKIINFGNDKAKLISYIPFLEVFVEMGVRMNGLANVMNKIAEPLTPSETFPEYYKRLLEEREIDLGVFKFPSGVRILEDENYHSWWRVAKVHFETQRGVEIPTMLAFYQLVIKEKLFDIYYEETGKQLLQKTYFDKLPWDFLRWFWFEILNPDFEEIIRRRGKAVEAIFALGIGENRGKRLDFSITRDDAIPLIQDLLRGFKPQVFEV